MIREKPSRYLYDYFSYLGTGWRRPVPQSGRTISVSSQGSASLDSLLLLEYGDVGLEEGLLDITGGGLLPQSTFLEAFAQAVGLLSQRLEVLEGQVRDLSDELSRKAVVSSVTLHDIGTDTPEVVLPIPIVIEQSEEETVATWPEVGLFGAGETPMEAIQSLKDDILETYIDLSHTPGESLGELAIGILRTLRRHLASRP